MNRNELIELTIKVYRLTLLFPKKEPLRHRIRETADDILEIVSGLEVINSPDYLIFTGVENKKAVFELEKNIGIIGSYFEIAKWQNWASYFDILEIQEKYDILRGKIKERIGEKYQDVGKADRKLGANREEKKLAPRKEKIVTFIKKSDKVQVGEISKILPDVSKRTIRRDFRELVEQGVIERVGEKNSTFYRLKHSPEKSYIHLYGRT